MSGKPTKHWEAYAPTKEMPWDRRRVVHLHRRAGFGATRGEQLSNVNKLRTAAAAASRQPTAAVSGSRPEHRACRLPYSGCRLQGERCHQTG